MLTVVLVKLVKNHSPVVVFQLFKCVIFCHFQVTRGLTINVLDVNDNRPRFSQNQYQARVREDATAGQPVTTVTVRDIIRGIMNRWGGGSFNAGQPVTTRGG